MVNVVNVDVRSNGRVRKSIVDSSRRIAQLDVASNGVRQWVNVCLDVDVDDATGSRDASRERDAVLGRMLPTRDFLSFAAVLNKM